MDWMGCGCWPEVAAGAGAERERFERRASWTPGAEGAPVYLDCDVEVGCAAAGTMRRDWLVVSML